MSPKHTVKITVNSQGRMREGEKKHLRKKYIESLFGKVNEGEQMKKTMDTFLQKLMRATK